MWRAVKISILLAGYFLRVLGFGWKDTPTLGSTDNPRILSRDITNVGYVYEVYQSHTVLLYQEDSEEMYVGGSDFVLKLDVENYHVIENISLTTEEQQCTEGPCQNVITVIEKFTDSLFVCGTNGYKPQCWKVFSSVNNQSNEIIEGIGISPFMHTQNSISLTVEGDLYSAAPLDTDGSSLHFRRKAGSRPNVWMYDKWVSEPTYITASWVRRKEDPDNDKMYIFFREKNSDNNPEADPWISKVARVCKSDILQLLDYDTRSIIKVFNWINTVKPPSAAGWSHFHHLYQLIRHLPQSTWNNVIVVDEGGSKRFFQNMWTSFLKARLVCGFPEESLYFNRLQDVYVMHAEDWQDTRVYALFSSSWNSTAVCIYSVGMIEEIFEKSTFKGYDKEIPTPRPGMCVKNSRNLPLATVSVVKDYPEMNDWVHSIHQTAPFYISSNNYIKIAVDQVQAADQHKYNILLLSTDSGRIHKVLEAGSEPFIISETQLSSHSSMQSMILDSKKKKLVVGYSEKISTVDLQRCQDYKGSCEDCVLARDPYCAWTEFGCTSTVIGGIQNIMDRDISVCNTSAEELRPLRRSKRGTVSPSPVDMRTHSVPLGVPFYLSCPIDSYHAVYTWEHRGQSSPCLQMRSNCLHLISDMAQENYGSYECISKERDYTKVVKKYLLTEQKIPDTKRDQIPNNLGDASAVASHIWFILGLAIAVTW